MNWKQMIILWVAIILIALCGLFPPYQWESSRWAENCVALGVDIGKLIGYWVSIGSVAGGLIYTFRDKKRKDE